MMIYFPYKRGKLPLDKDKAKENLKEILDRMQNNTDSALLHEYYRLFKKEIPFFKRSYAAAWLFMNFDEKEIPNFRGNDNLNVNKKPHNKKAVTQNESEKISDNDVSASDVNEKTIVSIPEEESKRLFISIGKNRRLFPREIITLLISKTSTAREDIGSIRILDNYSFVQVRDTKADEIIEKLTGHKFRGRTLSVNYAKPKSSETESE